VVAGLYSGYIIILCAFNPKWSPKDDRKITMMTRIKGLWDLVPIMVLIPIVLGGIYTGLATPSEAAALGVTAALILLALMRQLTWTVFVGSLMGAVRITCMVITIVTAASFMSTAMGYLHVPQGLGAAISKLGLGPYGLLILLFVFYLVLGLFLEGISILVMTMPMVLPLVLDAGFDRVWFAVFVTIAIEIAQITPPVGLNLYVLQGLTGMEIGRVAFAALPFFLLLCVAAVIVTIFPEIALWLPNALYGG
jgi:tripartite ATP-independent transporter DctM subunit